jgi:hypothetical protein
LRSQFMKEACLIVAIATIACNARPLHYACLCKPSLQLPLQQGQSCQKMGE